MEPELIDVVVVDDADDVRAVVARQLRLSGHFEVVGEGGTGFDAIELAGRHEPRVMVLDASMPDLDGLEALPGILEASPETRVVMLSGFGGRALETAARVLGAADFVEKAAPIRELPGRLLNLLEREGVLPAPEAEIPDEIAAAEQVMAQHLERFRTVFEQGAIGMATMTLSGTIVRANRALERLTGCTETELAGRRFVSLAGSDTAEELRTAITGLTRGEAEAAAIEHSLATDEERWARSTLTAVRDSRGRPLYLLAQAEDVTARRAALEKLRASEERFRILVESVVDYAIFMLDPDGVVTTWNAGAKRMKGYRADEIVGRHFRTFYPDEARNRRHPEHELEIALREGRYEEEGWRVRKDGTTFWANVVITALFDSGGNHVGFGKVTRDLTERRRAVEAQDRVAEELAAANRRLQQANDETAEFLAITAHELRGPIAAMTGAADVFEEHWDALDPAERQENLRNLIRSGARVRRLLDDLLMASRLEAGSIDFKLDDVPLAPLIAEAVSAAGLAAPIQAVCPDDLVVRCDPVRLVQIVTNLIANALRYGAPPLQITARPIDDAVEVRVSDAGPGISEDLEDRLFEKFVRGVGRRDRGAGLGLFIVRALVRGQGGDAWYERDADGRPCFVFTAPTSGG